MQNQYMAFVFVTPRKETDSAVSVVTARHFQYSMYPKAASVALLIGGGEGTSNPHPIKATKTMQVMEG